MQPIHELLNRIRWDPEFGRGEFVVCFLDRIEAQLIKLPLSEITFISGDHYFFHYLDEEGDEHCVPFHRIKAVYKNGEVIWQRAH
ncbi:MAG TPA: DUF504 domain-containing protein [Psychromonas sp.]